MTAQASNKVTPTRETSRSAVWESIVVSLFAGSISLAVGYYLVFKKTVVLGDAVSRVMNAYYIIFRGNLHFGAVGFVWNPFPSLIELPFVALHHIWPSLVTLGFAGNISSSVFASVSAYYLNQILYNFGLPRVSRLWMTALFCLNPMILYYSANGMSDAMLMGCLLGATDGVMTYLKRDRLDALSTGAIWLAVAFLFRYEAIPFFAITAIAVTICIHRMRKPVDEVEAMFVLYSMPTVYAIMAWMFLNWLIMKNPIYFLNSPYGNLSQIGTGSYASTVISAANHHLWKSFLLAGHFSLLFWPCLIGIGYAVLQQLRFQPDPRWLVLLGAVVSIPLFQVGMIYINDSAAWARFFIYYIPFGFLLIGLMVTTCPHKVRPYVAVLALCVILAGNFGTWKAMNSPVTGNGDFDVMATLKSPNQYANFDQEDAVSHYVNTHSKLIVLADTFDAYGVVARIDHYQQCVITSDIDFNSILENPRGRVNAFLVPEPAGISTLDAVNRMYPKMWSGGVSWAKLIVEFPGPTHYRLYEVTKQAP